MEPVMTVSDVIVPWTWIVIIEKLSSTIVELETDEKKPSKVLEVPIVTLNDDMLIVSDVPVTVFTQTSATVLFASVSFIIM
jgi:hypothetical protein